MSICILDPATHMPGMKLCFPDADYYAYPPDENFTYQSPQVNHMSNVEFESVNHFEYHTNWDLITSDRYDYLYIVLNLLDYDTNSHCAKPNCVAMLNRICERLIETNKFKKVVVFDVHDYDYDPSQLVLRLTADVYFKRNYNRKKTYSDCVKPLPYLMFVRPCLMTILFTTQPKINHNRINQAVWCGSLYDHDDNIYDVHRHRQSIYNQIKEHIITFNHLDYGSYLESIRNYKIVVDLCGFGDPNKRTFEILAEGSLLLTQITDLNWAFEDGDNFLPDVIFNDFKQKLDKLISDQEHYHKCLKHQNYLFQKYMNQEWISNYILKHI